MDEWLRLEPSDRRWYRDVPNDTLHEYRELKEMEIDAIDALVETEFPEETRELLMLELREVNAEIHRRRRIAAGVGKEIYANTSRVDLFALVRDRVTVLDHLGGTWPLKKYSKGWRGKCPIHWGDSVDAFSITADGKQWHCFRCNLGGGVIELVMAEQQCGPLDAARWIAEKVGIVVPEPPKAAKAAKAAASRTGPVYGVKKPDGSPAQLNVSVHR